MLITRQVPRPLQLVSSLTLMTAVASGAPFTQTISIANLDGALGMTQISRQPVPRMLEQARTILNMA